jgi:hypothetical protein
MRYPDGECNDANCPQLSRQICTTCIKGFDDAPRILLQRRWRKLMLKNRINDHCKTIIAENVQILRSDLSLINLLHMTGGTRMEETKMQVSIHATLFNTLLHLCRIRLQHALCTQILRHNVNQIYVAIALQEWRTMDLKSSRRVQALLTISMHLSSTAHVQLVYEAS